jgi:transposase InsO family protein
MPYTINPNLPHLRMQAARLVIDKGWSTREAARYTGFNQSTIVRWTEILRKTNYERIIPTKSSRPHSHPNELSHDLVSIIVSYRKKYRRCAEVIHHLLVKDGHEVSLSSVKRIIKRYGLTRYSQWKKWHQYPSRPLPEKPGILVQIDTMMDGIPDDRLSVYALIDVCSRWAYALPVSRINCLNSLGFVLEAKSIAPFNFQTLQTDHGSEFSKWFTKQLICRGLEHRHSRVRRPTDNGHIERFIRTLQEECLNRTVRTFSSWQKEIPEYIRYYNNERPHLSLQMKSPQEVMRSY